MYFIVEIFNLYLGFNWRWFWGEPDVTPADWREGLLPLQLEQQMSCVQVTMNSCGL